MPSLTGDIRHLIPRLGLREYWYPLCGAGRVKKNKPLRVRMLGEDICIFQGKAKGEVNAIGDVCPHRGARLSEGDCHFAGTVACPYHGWVFDGQGNNVANLSEGVGSIVRGKPGTEARAYPTRVLKGVVFIWMGDGVPAPIEEDVGEEFFRDDVHVFFNERIYWKTNWEVGLENTMDSHVQYLHRDYLMILLGGDSVSPGRRVQRYPALLQRLWLLDGRWAFATSGARPARLATRAEARAPGHARGPRQVAEAHLPPLLELAVPALVLLPPRASRL